MDKPYKSSKKTPLPNPFFINFNFLVYVNNLFKSFVLILYAFCLYCFMFLYLFDMHACLI